MSNTGDIKKAVKKLADTGEEVYSILCRVDSIDLTAKTCYCLPLDGGADISDVSLICDAKTGFMIIPTLQSIVMVTMQNKSTGFVGMFSQVDFIHLNGSNFSGIVKVTELVQKLNALEAFENTVIAAKNLIAAAAISAPTTPVTNATLAAFIVGISATPAVLTTITQLENNTVKHGNGN